MIPQPEGWKGRLKEFLVEPFSDDELEFFIATEVEVAYEEGKDAAYVALTNTASEALEAVRREAMEKAIEVVKGVPLYARRNSAKDSRTREEKCHDSGVMNALAALRAQLGKEDSSKE